MKILPLLLTGCLVAATLHAQEVYNTPVTYYNVPMQRFLARSTGNYINQVTQGQIGMDSAMAMACRIYHLNKLLPYNEAYDQQSTTPGMQLLGADDLAGAKSLLATEAKEDQFHTLCELATYYLFMPGNNADSALRYIDAANAILHSDAVLTLYGQYYAKKGDATRSNKYFTEAVKNSSGAPLVNVLTEQAISLPYNDPNKLKLLEKAQALSRQYKLPIKETELAGHVLTIHFATDPSLAPADIQRVLALQQSISFRHLQYVNNVLSYVADSRADYLAALEYARASVKYMQATGDSALSSVFYLRMGTVLWHLEKGGEAKDWYRKGLTRKTLQTKVFWYKNFMQQVHVLLYDKQFKEALELMNNISIPYPPETNFDRLQLCVLRGMAYDGMEQYKEAERAYNQFLVYVKSFPEEYDHSDLAAVYVNLSKLYFHQHRYAAARLTLQKSLHSALKSNAHTILPANYYLRFQLDSAEGKYQSALENYQSYRRYNDSTENVAQQQKFDQLRLLYETEKKDRDIETLTRSNYMQTTALRQSAMIRNIVLLGIGFVSVVALLLFYLYRSKRNSNKQLQSQQKEISEKNEVLENLVAEKEWLVKEIHHRVKNNLHTIVSLLESQTAYLGSDALVAVRDSQHRIHAMSLIHQKLYLSENITSVDMSLYIRELVGYLKESFRLSGAIQFVLDVETIQLDVSNAIPLGLILNEAITNSIKYAFPENEGIITVAFNVHDDLHTLTIADNGIGLPPALLANPRPASLGLTLIKGLCKEIGASFSLTGSTGTRICIEFRSPPF